MSLFNISKITLKLPGNVLVTTNKCNGMLWMVASPSVNQVCGISSKAMRHRNPSPPKPAPFPYKEKKYTLLRSMFDYTTSRFDENSKLIVVEGPPAAGKGALAKELANELDMLYLPSPTMDKVYINEYGFDGRQLDSQLPENCRSYDEKDFLKNPKNKKAGRMQLMKLKLRFKQHLEALVHILNTGQGVVMDRCSYSDHVYIDAMAKAGFISKSLHNYYYEAKNNALGKLWRPHLVIYLDVPVPEVRRRIEQRNYPNEKDSLAVSPEYLEALEKSYKEKYLKSISTHAELLVYDWSEVGDPEIVVEDIERIDFDNYSHNDPKMADWRHRYDADWDEARLVFNNEQVTLEQHLEIPAVNCPEILVSGEDFQKFSNIWFNAPGNKYAPGFNRDMGDSVLLKLK
nr:EOG090X05NZ [Cyclestheria hislopi]